MTKQNEKALYRIVRKAMKGDTRALEKLLREVGSLVLYRCIKLMGSTTEGEDAAQEVFSNVQKSIQRLSDERAFHVWLHKITLRVCYRQRNKRMQGYVPIEEVNDVMADLDPHVIPEQYLQNAQRKEWLLNIISKLPVKMRDVILLYYFEDLSVKEIAQIYETTENSINVTLHRARQKIQSAIEEDNQNAYTSMPLVPFAGITALFESDILALAPASAVESCIQAAGIGGSWLLGTKIISFLKAVAIAATGTAVIVSALFAFVYLPSLESVAPQPSKPQIQTESVVVGTQQESYTIESYVSVPKGASYVATPWYEHAITGRVYIDDPANPKSRTWEPVIGATVQLFSEDGTQSLSEPLPADGVEGFKLPTGGMGTFRVLITLPQKAQFVLSDNSDVILLENNPSQAWLTLDGSPLLSITEQVRAISSIGVIAYYPAQISGMVTSTEEEVDLGGLTIDLINAEGYLIASAVTSSDGSYVFSNPPLAYAGNYIVALREPLPFEWAEATTADIMVELGVDILVPVLTLFTD